MMDFFVGVTEPTHAYNLCRLGIPVMLGIQRLRRRKSEINVGSWFLDSRAYNELILNGRFLTSALTFADEIDRWAQCGKLLAVGQQDWNCAPDALAATGLTVRDHQLRTVENYEDLVALVRSKTYVMPVLQGQSVDDYLSCLDLFGDRISNGQWVGVGGLKPIANNPEKVWRILAAICDRKPLRLHGFGLTLTTIKHDLVWKYLHSFDTTAWAFHARKNQLDQNHWSSAYKYNTKINDQIIHHLLDLQSIANLPEDDALARLAGCWDADDYQKSYQMRPSEIINNYVKFALDPYA